jgi:hypothetical protein
MSKAIIPSKPLMLELSVSKPDNELASAHPNFGEGK